MGRKVLSVLIATSMVLSLTACGNSKTATTTAAPAKETKAPEVGESEVPAVTATEGKSYTINVASTYAPEGPVHQVIKEFKSNIEGASGGRIKVVIHPSGALGGVKEVTEGLHAGTIEMGVIALEDCDYYCPEYSLLEAPYLFRDADHFKKVLTDHGDEIFSAIQEKSGIKTCTWFYRGARMITANKEIKTPADMAGLKFRLPSMPLRVAVFEVFGASPTIVEFSELYMALKTGTVDAQENPPETIYSYKYYEAQKYLMLSRHIFTLARYGASESWFNTLTPEDQELIMTAWQDAHDKVTEEVPDPDVIYIDKCKEAGMEVVTPENDKFIELATSAVKAYVEKNGGQEILEMIENTK